MTGGAVDCRRGRPGLTFENVAWDVFKGDGGRFDGCVDEGGGGRRGGLGRAGEDVLGV